MIVGTIVEDGRVVGTICGPGPMKREVVRRDGDLRWCFVCRTRRNFVFTLDREVEPSYYGPTPAIRCESCETADADLFPGRYREWGE